MPNRVRAAAMLALLLCTAPVAARAATTLSDGSVSATSGTTETPFILTVRYTSTDRPTRPAQSVWAQIGSVTVPLVKVAGTAHDGTWQATTTLPAGTWSVTFHAATSGDPTPDPYPGPTVTVIPAPAAPRPTTVPLPVATPPPPAGEVPGPTPPPTDGSAGTADASAEGSRTLGDADSKAAAFQRAPSPTLAAQPDGYAISPTTEPGGGLTASRERGSLQVPLLLVGGAMSLAGAALLARHWLVSRNAPRPSR